MKKLKVDLVDEHYYRSPEWFLKNAGRYDSYDRSGPKVFAGEYAAHPQSRANNFEGALAEAAFMTGLERNADMVEMATYAPLFAHVDAWQWRPDMIWFDNLKSVCSPNYYVQQLYASNAGTNVLPISCDGSDLKGENGLYASAAFDKHSSEIILKLVNTNQDSKEIQLMLNGMKRKKMDRLAEVVYLQSNDLNVENTLDAPLNIVPQHTFIETEDNAINMTLERNSFFVVKIKLK